MNLKQYEYYRTPLGVLYNCDCLTILPHLEPVDLVLTSPPYDNLRDYGGYSFDFKKTGKALFKLIKDGGVCVWVVGDETQNGSESGTAFKHALHFKHFGFNLHDTMIYSKAGFAFPSNERYHQTFEYMFIFSKRKPNVFNPIKDKLNRYSRRGGDFSRQKNGKIKHGNKGGLPLKRYGQRYNIWEYKVGGGNVTKDKVAYKHPAIFPESLARDHIISWSNQNDTVLDPMCGSGTTLKQAEKLKRKWIGIEIEEKYCEIAAKRVELERKQLKLFT